MSEPRDRLMHDLWIAFIILIAVWLWQAAYINVFSAFAVGVAAFFFSAWLMGYIDDLHTELQRIRTVLAKRRS